MPQELVSLEVVRELLELQAKNFRSFVEGIYFRTLKRELTASSATSKI